jgi:hypothetical protein
MGRRPHGAVEAGADGRAAPGIPPLGDGAELSTFLLFGLALEHHVRWIAVLVGVALFYAGLTGLTGILQTYMLEAYIIEPMNAMACVASL